MRVRVARWHAAARVMQRRWRQRAAAFEQALIEKEWNALKRAEEEEAAAAARAEAERRASRDAFEAWAPYVNVELIIEEERTVECLHVVATVISAAARGHAARRAVRQEHRWSLRERREEAKQARRDAREAQAWAVEQAKLKAKAAAAIAREKAEEDAKQQRARAAAQRKARAEIIAARERARAVEQVTQTPQHAFDRFADTSREPLASTHRYSIAVPGGGAAAAAEAGGARACGARGGAEGGQGEAGAGQQGAQACSREGPQGPRRGDDHTPKPSTHPSRLPRLLLCPNPHRCL